VKIISETDRKIEFYETAYSVVALGAVFALIGVATYVVPQFFPDPPPWWLGIIFLLIGLPIMLYPTYRLDVSVDRSGRTITLTRHTLIKKEKREIKMDEIAAIRYSQKRDNKLVSEKGKLRTRKDWQEKIDIIAVMKNGDDEHIVRSTRIYSAIGNSLESKGLDENPHLRLAKRIAELTGVPLSE
jgi:hypothetical protein